MCRLFANVMRVFILCLMCLFLHEAHADYGAGHLPEPRIFSSQDGEENLRVVPVREGVDRGKSKATLFRLNRDGSELRLREWMFPNTPQLILLPGALMNYVVALDTSSDMGWKNAIVIYNRSGKLMHTLEVEDLFSLSERNDHVKYSVSSRRWRGGATFNFEVPFSNTLEDKGDFKIMHTQLFLEKARLNIVFALGKKTSIELATGKVEDTK